MRALCGAIISAAALIGLGLTALGIGTRYQGMLMASPEGRPSYVKFHEMDTPMMFVVVVLSATLIVGIATAFIGLAYHHQRRHHERLGGETHVPQPMAP